MADLVAFTVKLTPDEITAIDRLAGKLTRSETVRYLLTTHPDMVKANREASIGKILRSYGVADYAVILITAEIIKQAVVGSAHG